MIFQTFTDNSDEIPDSENTREAQDAFDEYEDSVENCDDISDDNSNEDTEKEFGVQYTTTDERLIGLQKENIIELTYIDSDTVFENKHIMLFDYLKIRESLTMKDCLIEICGGGFIGDAGKLHIQGCEIVNPLKKLISGRFYECDIKDTSFIFAAYYPGQNVINSEDELLFDTCRFVNLNPRYSKEKSNLEMPPFLNAPEATLKSCELVDFSSFTEIRVGNALDCNFVRCCEVTVLESLKGCCFSSAEHLEFSSEASESCEFTECAEIVFYGDVKDCHFKKLCTLNDCAVITVSGGSMTNCSFTEIKGNAILARLLGGSVTDAEFCDFEAENPKALFTGEKKGGFLGLKKITYSPF